MRFSIIVPVFNAESTLCNCLDSIQRQSVRDFEVIMVDDGSMDESLKICTMVCEEDQRFRVLHQSNQGPSAARNRALDIAKGDWICFVDSDDVVEENYLQKISDIIERENPDVIFIGYRQLNMEGIEIGVKLPPNLKKEKSNMVLELSKNDMFGYTWIKTFKKRVIGETRFDQSLNLFEDEVFTCQVIEKCNHIGIVEEPIYNYITGISNSLTGKTHQDYCKKCDAVYKEWKKIIKIESRREEVLANMADRFVERCRYYGFERNVNYKAYFHELSQTTFFMEKNRKGRFDQYVQNHRYMLILFEKYKYLLKVKISEMLRG